MAPRQTSAAATTSTAVAAGVEFDQAAAWEAATAAATAVNTGYKDGSSSQQQQQHQQQQQLESSSSSSSSRRHRLRRRRRASVHSRLEFFSWNKIITFTQDKGTPINFGRQSLLYFLDRKVKNFYFQNYITLEVQFLNWFLNHHNQQCQRVCNAFNFTTYFVSFLVV